MSETPDLKKLEQTLKAMTPEQFTALCAELGLVEDLLGSTRDEQIKTLLVHVAQSGPRGPRRAPRLAGSL